MEILKFMGDVKIHEQFTSIGRLIISSYDEPIEIKGKAKIGSGCYLRENFGTEEKLLNIAGKISKGKIVY